MSCCRNLFALRIASLHRESEAIVISNLDLSSIIRKSLQRRVWLGSSSLCPRKWSQNQVYRTKVARDRSSYPIAMSHHGGIQRTAPIAIAPKPPRAEPAVNGKSSNGIHGKFEIGPASRQSRGSAKLASFTRSQSPPCRACRYGGVKCVMGDEEDGCISCQVNGNDCTLSQSPQSRKRKLNGDQLDMMNRKKRLVTVTMISASTPGQQT